MKNALLLHGSCDKEEYYSDEYPSLSNSHWFPWLQKQLLIRDIFTQTPELPKAYGPTYEDWKKEFERHDITAETILVGHSCGGGFLVRWLSENDVNVDKVVLVAPWLDPENRRTSDFFDFDVDKNLVAKANKFHVLYSADDMPSVLESVKKLTSAVDGLPVTKFENKGHFCFDNLGTEEFPELLELLIA
ncbi:hypothetical protein GF360_01575 [candidate division WWE3 bacterium]|nr:hypothetical protein [candidate division WWE3 bacterium]